MGDRCPFLRQIFTVTWCLVSFPSCVLGKPLHISEGSESFPSYLPPTEDHCLPFGCISPSCATVSSVQPPHPAVFSVHRPSPHHSPPRYWAYVPYSVLYLAFLGWYIVTVLLFRLFENCVIAYHSRCIIYLKLKLWKHLYWQTSQSACDHWSGAWFLAL